MPTTAPVFYKSADVSFKQGAGAATVVQCHARIAAFVPEEAEVIRYNTLCAEGSYVALGRQLWNLELTGLQAYGDASDLARFLFDHQGETWSATVQIYGEGIAPSATTPAMSADVIIAPGAYGGELDTYLEVEVVLPAMTAPALVTVPPVMEEPEAAAA